MSKERHPSEQQVLEGKIFAILAYLSILCIIPLIVRKNNRFVLTHGKQGLVLFIAETAVWILSIVIPMVLAPLMFILMLLSFCGLIAVVKGEFVRLPIAADWCR